MYRWFKGFCAGCLAMTMVLSAGSGAIWAAGDEVETDSVILQLDNSHAMVRGTLETLDAPPILDGERTLAPVRFVAEKAANAKVAWNPDTWTATITDDKGNRIEIAIDQPYLVLNGKSVPLDVPAKLVKERTMLPLRAIVEALGKLVYWDEKHQLIVISDTKKTIDAEVADKLAGMLSAGTQPKEDNLPKSGSASAHPQATPTPSSTAQPNTGTGSGTGTGAGSVGDPATGTTPSPVANKTLNVGGRSVSIGMGVSEVIKTFGQPDRVSPSGRGFDWYVYNSDYFRFVMIGIGDGTVRGFATNASTFVYDGKVAYGSASSQVGTNTSTVYYVVDKIDNQVNGIVVMDAPFSSASGSDQEALLRANELEIADFTNALRVAKGLRPLTVNDTVANVSRLHSADMAEHAFFSHTNPAGENPGDRLNKEPQLTTRSSYGENIAAGNSTGYQTYEQWLNSSGHRANMLNAGFEQIGIGAVYNKASEYKYYYTQMFYNPFKASNTTTGNTSIQTSSTMSYNDFIAYTSKLLANTLILENERSNNGKATSNLAADSSPLWNQALENTAADIPSNECSWTVKIDGHGLLTWWGQNSTWANNYTPATAQEIVDYFIKTRLTGTGYLHDDTVWRKSLPKGIAVGISMNQTTGRTFFNVLSEENWSGTNGFYN